MTVDTEKCAKILFFQFQKVSRNVRNKWILIKQVKF